MRRLLPSILAATLVVAGLAAAQPTVCASVDPALTGTSCCCLDAAAGASCAMACGEDAAPPTVAAVPSVRQPVPLHAVPGSPADVPDAPFASAGLERPHLAAALAPPLRRYLLACNLRL